MKMPFQKQIGHSYWLHAEVYHDSDKRYNEGNYTRLSLSFFTCGLWLGRCNWFKGRGVEVFFSIHSFTIGFGFTKPYYGSEKIFRKRFSGSSREPYHNVVLQAWRFGVQLSLPKIAQRWLAEQSAREFEKWYEGLPEEAFTQQEEDYS